MCSVARNNRVCRVGAGKEKTPGGGDTPGFPLRKKPEISIDNKGSKKLFLERNHTRIVQCADNLLQAWRGNCDVQILIYESDPDCPDPAEIARVTDYVVAYSCKGNKTLKEEREQSRNLVMRSEDLTGSIRDVNRVVTQALNQTCSNRIISKQECCVLLGKLNLVTCTESIESISLSNSTKITLEGESPKKNFITKYKNRSPADEDLSLHQFFLNEKEKNVSPDAKYIIPHFVGINSQPTYPVTKAYAKATCVIHKPWRDTIDDNYDWIAEFDSFLLSNTCPQSVKIAYGRVQQRFVQKMMNYEPVAYDADTSGNPIDPDDLELMQLCGLHANKAAEGSFFDILKSVDKGEDFDWSKSYFEVCR